MLRYLLLGSRERRFSSAVRIVVGEFRVDWRRMHEKQVMNYLLEPICLGYLTGFTRKVVHAHHLEAVFRATEAVVSELADASVAAKCLARIKATFATPSFSIFEDSMGQGEHDAQRFLERSPAYIGAQLSFRAELMKEAGLVPEDEAR
jgi:hypothetical protein